jgi:hypothetical protein
MVLYSAMLLYRDLANAASTYSIQDLTYLRIYEVKEEFGQQNIKALY